jgi:hypothetical protein
MRNIYVNESTNPIREIPLSTTGVNSANCCLETEKDTWYVIKPWSKKNVIEALTPRQFHEAVQNGNR